jgi:aspartate kinase
MDAMKPWIVQKYGGTSIGKLLHTITGSIVPEFLQTYNIAVVCSARSGTSKSKGTTTLLLEAIHYATSNESSTGELDRVIDIIQEEHLIAARAVGSRNDGLSAKRFSQEDLEVTIRNDCEQVRGILRATWTVGEISERTQDRVLAVGEKLAVRIVVAALESEVSESSSTSKLIHNLTINRALRLKQSSSIALFSKSMVTIVASNNNCIGSIRLDS